MIKTLTNKIIRLLGRSNYSIDPELSTLDVINILTLKCWQYFKGILYRPFFKKVGGSLFIGKKVKILFGKKIILGRTVFIGDFVEINALSKLGIKIGNNVSILRNSIIECTGVIRNLGEELIIGDNVGIAQNCFIQVRGKVTIGNNVIFGPGVSVYSENHNYSNLEVPISQQGENRKGVIIGDGVWLGAGSTILDGVNIGSNSIVAAGSVVTKDVPPFTIAGGVPAKILKYRKQESVA